MKYMSTPTPIKKIVKEFDGKFTGWNAGTFPEIKDWLKTTLNTYTKELLTQISDIDCPCDASDCERCEYLRAALKQLKDI